ncbi:MAG: hypothetical protein AB3N12_01440 [Ruegeria sp.]
MTTEAFTEVDPYDISGTGPYAIGHAYALGAITALVEQEDGTLIGLVAGVDFSVLPEEGESGDLTLSAGAATTYDGDTLLIRRRTAIEQSFAGQTTREIGLEANLDRLAMAAQETETQTYRSLRLPAGALATFTPEDGRMPVWSEANQRFENGPVSDEIPAAQVYAELARNYANALEDAEVEPGLFSAFHWAAKALASATAAATFDPANFYTQAQANALFIPFSGGVRRFGTGASLPTSDAGVIWHDDYNSFMTWQVFDQNGASYSGYASQYIGRPLFDGQPTARLGDIKGNGANLSDATHAALKAWAQHNGNFVSLGSWTAGAFHFADNGDGTFRIPEIRAETFRAWDDGRGIDVGRAFGSWQADALQGHEHNARSGTGGGGSGSALSRTGSSASQSDNSGVNQVTTDATYGDVRVASETRPRSTALLGSIKF